MTFLKNKQSILLCKTGVNISGQKNGLILRLSAKASKGLSEKSSDNSLDSDCCYSISRK